MYKINITGLENIPKDSNYILAGNHLNILDSWLLIVVTDEYLRFMVDKKLYNTKIGEWFFKKVGTFDIDPNEKDPNKKIKAVKNAVELLKAGEKVVIFPEGKTHSIDVCVPFKDGVPAISKLGNTVLVPFGISGNYKPFTELNINIGEPINFKELKLKKEEENLYLEYKVRKLEQINFEEINRINEEENLYLEDRFKKIEPISFEELKLKKEEENSINKVRKLEQTKRND